MVSVAHVPAGTCCKHQGFLTVKLAPPPALWNLSETCILGFAASQPTVDSDPVRTMQPASDPNVGLPHAGRSSAGFHKSGWKKFRVTGIPNTRKNDLALGSQVRQGFLRQLQEQSLPQHRNEEEYGNHCSDHVGC